jgi:hypothetical protein
VTTIDRRFFVDDVGIGDVAVVDPVASARASQQVAESLRAGRCPLDAAFDRFLPHRLRIVSGQYWTPLVVTLRVAGWLDEVGVDTVVDIGSGAGKFCVATALASQCKFTGLEQRGRLVAAARDLARLFAVDDRVRFVEGTVGRDSIPDAEAYYLYNSFGENLFGPEDHLDQDVELNHDRFRRDVEFMHDFFEAAPVGTHIIKYNGFGGRMPHTYDAVFVDREMPNVLRVWRKNRSR